MNCCNDNTHRNRSWPARPARPTGRWPRCTSIIRMTTGQPSGRLN